MLNSGPPTSTAANTFHYIHLFPGLFLDNKQFNIHLNNFYLAFIFSKTPITVYTYIGSTDNIFAELNKIQNTF